MAQHEHTEKANVINRFVKAVTKIMLRNPNGPKKASQNEEEETEKTNMINRFVNALAKLVFRNLNGAKQPSPNEEPINFDDEVLPPRFVYEPKNFVHRLYTGIGGKTMLASSQLLTINYRSWLRWVLVILLAITSIAFTPQFLPQWVGLNYSTASDLCSSREEKLDYLRRKMVKSANVEAGELFIDQAEQALQCMRNSTELFWNGLDSVLYPTECVISNAKTKTTPTTVCVGGQRVERCLKTFGLTLKCSTATTPRKCKTVQSTDPESVRRIAELNEARRSIQNKTELSEKQKGEVQEIAQTATKQSKKIIRRLLMQIDIANNLYIGYTILAILVGTPIVIHHRNRKSRIIGAALGLKKSNFVLLVVIALSVYDTGSRVLRATNLSELVRDFQNDACYLDPDFSQARLEHIRDTCGNITAQRSRLNDKLASMTSVFYSAQLCEVSSAHGFEPRPNATLVATIGSERTRYANGTASGFAYPGACNATQLDEDTSRPLESGRSLSQAILASGVLAQLMLKGIIATWATHLVGYIEPMTMHRGIVEVFGMPQGTPASLTKAEIDSVVRYARDKHLLQLIVSTMLMIWEVAIIFYRYVENQGNAGDLLKEVIVSQAPPIKKSLKCVGGKLA